MIVKELIEELKNFDQNAVITVGDKFNNGISISWGYSDGCTKSNCEFVIFEAEENSKHTEEK